MRLSNMSGLILRRNIKMPNHVSNVITLKGHKDDIIKCLSTIMRDNDTTENENKYEGIGTIDFEKIIPMPKEIYRGNIGPEERKFYGSNNWYDWSVMNWGTKWNAYNFYAHEIMPVDISEGEDYTMEFDTAWNPPYPVIKTLSEMYPELEIEHLYFDEFLTFAGIVIYKDGLPKDFNLPTNPKEVFELVCSEYWHCTPEEDGAVLNILNNNYVYLGNAYYLRCTIEFDDKCISGLTNSDWSIDKREVPNMMRYYTVRMRNNTPKGIDSFNFNAGRNNDDAMSFMVMADALDASTIDRMNKHPEKIYLTISDTDNDVSLEEFINENTKA